MAGAAVLSTRGVDVAVTYIERDQVASAFQKGAPLLETGAYKIHASRREAAGQAEVHTRDTDIIHGLTGTAVSVTGGAVIDGKTTAPDEVRGASIKGGESTSERSPALSILTT